MEQRDRDRLLKDAVRRGLRSERMASEALETAKETRDVVTGTATRLMVIAWLGVAVAAFCGCALFHALLGG